MEITTAAHSLSIVIIILLGLPFFKAIAVVIAGKIAGSPSTSYFKPVGLYYLIVVILIGYVFATGSGINLENLTLLLFEVLTSVIVAAALFRPYRLDTGKQKLLFVVACVIVNLLVLATLFFLLVLVAGNLMK